MTYAALGARRAVAAPDQTGNNPGFLTTVLDPSVIAIQVPYFECYRGVVTNCPPGAIADIYVDAFEVSCNWFGELAEWDPDQPPILQPGQSIFIYWSLPSSTLVLPVTTLWFRYDPAFYVNPEAR